jgi:hypothetical protein
MVHTKVTDGRGRPCRTRLTQKDGPRSLGRRVRTAMAPLTWQIDSDLPLLPGEVNLVRWALNHVSVLNKDGVL